MDTFKPLTDYEMSLDTIANIVILVIFPVVCVMVRELVLSRIDRSKLAFYNKRLEENILEIRARLSAVEAEQAKLNLELVKVREHVYHKEHDED
jgi:hypothetical protein